jgi:hypothetical protein
MMQLTKSLATWGAPAFKQTLAAEIEQLDPALLPLQQGLSRSSYAIGTNLKAIVLGVTEEAGFIRAKTGIFYSGIIAGCSCADDPTPVDEVTEYCVVQFDIDKATAATTVTLLPDE